MIEELEARGTDATHIVGWIGATPHPDDGFPLRQVLFDYHRIDDMGRAWEMGFGPQGATRESRTTAFADLCVAEIDLKAAWYQLFVYLLRQFLSDEEVEELCRVVLLYIEFGQEWKSHVAAYYAIDESCAKKIFTRLPLHGSLVPDDEWEPTRGNDILPCLLELRQTFLKGMQVLAERSEKLQEISAMPKIRAKEHPSTSAFALLLQDLYVL